MDIEIRELQIRKVNENERTFVGVAVPWDKETDIGGIYKEKFSRGSISDVSNTKIFYGHSEVIGKLVSGRDTDEGYEVTGYISDTTRGNDTRTMMRDGTLDRLSVGFIPVEHTVDEETGTITRTKVDLKEISVVPFPAYEGAQISEVRAEEDNTNATNKTKEVVEETTTHENMENENTYDDSELRGQVETLTREFAVAKEEGFKTDVKPVSEYRSAGEWAVAYIQGDEKARAETRDVSVTSADAHPGNDWRGGVIDVINDGRPLVTMFEQNTVPRGNKTFEFLAAMASSGAVATQTNEGDLIANMSGSIDTEQGTLRTKAGYIETSFQTDDFSDVNLVDGLIRELAASYAKVTNDTFRTALTGASAQTGASVTLSSAGADDWLDAVTYGAFQLKQNASFNQTRNADFAVASIDVFRALAKAIDDNGRPLFNVSGQAVNSIGNVNNLGLTLSVAGLSVVLDAGLGATSKSLYICNSHAVGSWEYAGSPFDLKGIDVTHLKTQYALWGYYEAKVRDANGLVKIAVS